MIPISSLLMIVGIVLLLDLTPERITDDILRIITPKQSLRDKVRIAQGRKKSRKISVELEHIKTAMTATGKQNQFAILCALSVALMVCGGFFAMLMDNGFLAPILAAGFCLLPFIYAKASISHYDRHIEQEMETALSIITTSYIRSDNIISAVEENLDYIKPPVTDIFKTFLGDASAVSADLKQSLRKLRSKIDNTIFHEWCDTLIQCQDDRTQKNTLLSVVGKLTDVRIVNSELKTMLGEPRKEYFIMAMLLVGNVPLLYILNQSWYNTLMTSLPGKLILALSGITLLVTALLVGKYTKPIEYRR